MHNQFPLFDSHFHIIDPRYPLVPNQGYLPDAFTTQDYLQRMHQYQLVGGAVVSGSFQGFDQTYLLAALKVLGDGFVGVTQVPVSITDTELLTLHEGGVRAVRFNLKRGGSEDVSQLASMADRVYELCGWHIELYVDAVNLPDLRERLVKLPKVSIDHLGLSKAGLSDIRYLLEKNVRLKACGFGRVDFEVPTVLPELYAINPDALMFGSDLPSTRAPRPYLDSDYALVVDALNDFDQIMSVFNQNARKFYLNE